MTAFLFAGFATKITSLFNIGKLGGFMCRTITGSGMSQKPLESEYAKKQFAQALYFCTAIDGKGGGDENTNTKTS